MQFGRAHHITTSAPSALNRPPAPARAVPGAQHGDRLDSEINYDRDFDYDYFGFKVGATPQRRRWRLPGDSTGLETAPAGWENLQLRTPQQRRGLPAV